MADISILIPTLINIVVMIVIVYILFRAYQTTTKKIFQDIVDDAIKKLRDEQRTINALRMLR